MSYPPGSPSHVYLTPLAILLGFTLCAVAIYRSGPHRLSTPILSPPPPQRLSAAAPLERSATSHGLRDLFRPHQQAAVARCGLDPALAGDPTVALAELPLSLTVASDGRITEAVPAGSARVFDLDGALRRIDFGEDRARCYAALVRDWVRFSAAESPSRLEAPLRVVDMQ